MRSCTLVGDMTFSYALSMGSSVTGPHMLSFDVSFDTPFIATLATNCSGASEHCMRVGKEAGFSVRCMGLRVPCMETGAWMIANISSVLHIYNHQVLATPARFRKTND